MHFEHQTFHDIKVESLHRQPRSITNPQEGIELDLLKTLVLKGNVDFSTRGLQPNPRRTHGKLRRGELHDDDHEIFDQAFLSPSSSNSSSTFPIMRYLPHAKTTTASQSYRTQVPTASIQYSVFERHELARRDRRNIARISFPERGRHAAKGYLSVGYPPRPMRESKNCHKVNAHRPSPVRIPHSTQEFRGIASASTRHRARCTAPSRNTRNDSEQSSQSIGQFRFRNLVA